MTRKDYELLAYAILLSKRSGYAMYEGQHRDTAECIADALQGNNPRFDRDRFLRACGVSDGRPGS